MESYYVTALLACLFALVLPSLQYDDRVLSLKEAQLTRMARRDRGGSRLRINGEYFGRNGGSVQGSLRGDSRRRGDFFRGVNRRGRLEGAFDARLPSGAGLGARANLRREMNVGLSGISGGLGGQLEGGIDGPFGNHFGGGFQGGFQGRVNVPVVAAGYVAGPNLHREVYIG